jgi:hypothetical protein
MPAVEVLLLALAWGVRELVPVVANRLRQAERAGAADQRTLADGSGAHAAILPEALATRREVEELREHIKATEQRFAEVVGRLESRAVELEKVLAVLKDRAGMVD